MGSDVLHETEHYEMRVGISQFTTKDMPRVRLYQLRNKVTDVIEGEGFDYAAALYTIHVKEAQYKDAMVDPMSAVNRTVLDQFFGGGEPGSNVH